MTTYLGSAAVAALVLTGMRAGHAGGGTAASLAPVPLAGGQQQWAQAFLSAAGEPQTPCNVAAVTAWEVAEGGGVTNDAAYNPLNTTEREPGSWPVNSIGVQAYPSYAEGLQANVTVIQNGLYGGILAALQQGGDAQAVADAVAASPWGTEPFTATC
jgi:hypothetical protein